MFTKSYNQYKNIVFLLQQSGQIVEEQLFARNYQMTLWELFDIIVCQNIYKDVLLLKNI